MTDLLLFTRAGCCLCEGLEERLRSLRPAPSLTLLDVDAHPALEARYGLSVPVLAVPLRGADGQPASPAWRELPRVPPRLSGPRLRDWLIGNGAGAALAAGPAGEGPTGRPGDGRGT
jgi:hypothetical protein